MEDDESWHEQQDQHSSTARQRTSEGEQHIAKDTTKITLFYEIKMGVGGYDVMRQGSHHIRNIHFEFIVSKSVWQWLSLMQDLLLKKQSLG